MSAQTQARDVKVTVLDLQKKKAAGTPITMLTAYDYSSALLVDKAGIDTLLVGDSLGMVMLGLDSTLPVTMDQMIHHCRAVARGAKRPFLIGDMPFMSYQVSIPEAVRHAGRFLQEGGMEAIKLEGGAEVAETVRAIYNAGIPVLGHVGLTPQSISKLGGFKVQGRTADSAAKLLADALALQEAGCFAVVLEAVPARVAEVVTRRLTIPTIGIGAGAGCDGQVLVYHDLLGLFDKFQPRFVRQYANVAQVIAGALEQFRQEVEAGQFPAAEHTFSIKDEEFEDFLANSQ